MQHTRTSPIGLRKTLSFLLCMVVLLPTILMRSAGIASAATTWNAPTSNAETNNLNGIRYGSGRWISPGAYSHYATSTDGANWTDSTISGATTLNDAFYSGQWVIAGSLGKIYSSPDGTTWTSRTSGTSQNLWTLYGNGSTFVAAGDGGTIVTGNGTTFSAQTAGANPFYGVTYGGGQFIAVGASGTIYTSPDGTAWTARNSGTSNDLYAVAYANNLYVAVGMAGTMLTSANGVSWTLGTSGTSNGLNGVDHGPGKWVAVGMAGTIISSTDGISWTSETSGTSNDLFHVAQGNGLWVAVGASGTILTQVALSNNANLSNLTISQGTLNPAFASGTTAYTASVPYTTTSLNVTPTVQDATATVKVNGTSTASGSPATVPLSVGANTITVFVTAQDGTPKTYTITVTRAAPSTNANLSNLTISQGTLTPAFASGTTAYTATVGNAVTSVNVTPTVADSTATVTVNGAAATSGSPKTVSLNVGMNPISVVVTAQDGVTQKTYTLTVTRVSNNANLSNLTLSNGTLSPAFTAGTTSYTASVPYAVSSVDVTPTVADSTATVTVNGSAAASGTPASVALSIGANPVTTVVTAQDGTTKTYAVTVTRAAASTNASLSGLALSTGTLSPTFAGGTVTYTASVAYSVSSVNVTATVADGTATLQVNGSAATSGSAVTVPLAVGDNAITVLVTAEDTSTTTYTVTVTRAAPSANAALSDLALSAGTLTPAFSSGTFAYTATVVNSASSLDVTPTVADATATVTVNGTAVASGNPATVPLAVGANTIAVQVTAEDGTTRETYTVVVTRLSNNAHLSSLALTGGTLTPTFDANTVSYTAGVLYAVTSVDVTAAVADSTASMTVNGSATPSGTAVPVSLYVGANTVTVVVTAQDGTTKTYTVTVTRAPASNNATLSSLALSAGTLTPSFASGTFDYTATVANATVSIDVTPTLADSTATITVNGGAASSGSPATVPLNVGANTVTVQVTAEDGTTQRTYTVEVTRLSNNANLSGLTLSSGTLTPTFDANAISYTATVANSVTNLDVTPTVADSTATLTVNGSAAASGSTVTVPLAVGGNSVTVQVTAQDGTTKTYTVTVTRLSNNADLSGLAISPGALTPAFDSNTLSYTASYLYAVASVDVTPMLADSTATMTVNGSAATSGATVSVPLIVGGNTITVAVTAQDGTPKTYTITATRGPASNNADLSSLTLSAGALTPAFASGTFEYTATVGNSVTSLDATPTLADATATVTVNGSASTSGTAVSVPLNLGANTITVRVTAEDGATQETYTVVVTRLSNNANLSDLTLSQGTLTPSFDANTISYTASVLYAVTSVDVTPILADGTATMTVNGSPATTGNAVIVPLTVGANTATIVVTAQDGTTKTYTVTVARAPASSNANLSGLTLSDGTLTPAFAAGTADYTASVGNATTSIDVTPTLADSTAIVTVNGSAVSGGSPATVALSVGPNPITVQVTAEDGTTTKTYSVTVTRAPSRNADLSGLTLSAGTLTPSLDPTTASYTASVANAVTSIDVTPTLADSTATVTVNGTATASGSPINVPLSVGDTAISVVVIAQDGTTTQTYTVTVTRAPSSNADLSNLTLSAGHLTPTFSAGTTSYTASVPYGTVSIIVTPTLVDATATMTVDGSPTASGSGGSVALHQGVNTITILNTAQDGVTTKTYTVTVIVNSPPPPPAAPPTLTVSGGVVTATTPTITGTATLSDGAAVSVTVEGAAYTGTVEQQVWSITVTSPLSAGVHSVTATGTNAAGLTGSATGIITVKVAPTVAPIANQTNKVGDRVSLTVSATGAPGSRFAYSATGLPDRLGINPTTGAITGNVTREGTYQVTITVTEQVAGGISTQTFTWRVLKPGRGTLGGTVTDAATAKPLTGVSVTLMWAGTDPVGSEGRTPDTAVTAADGTYAWAALPPGDYYILARKDGYKAYDSREAGLFVGGADSNVRGGIIHIGETSLTYDFALTPDAAKHTRYVGGYPDGTFGPERSITRAEVASVLAHLLEAGAGAKAGKRFGDVSPDHWAAGAIARVAAAGLMQGDPSGRFRPDDPVSRAEVAVIIFRLLKLTQATASFSDVGGHWAAPYIGAISQAGIMLGYPDGTFRPDQQTTRAEFVTIINRATKRGPLVDVPAPTFPDVPLDHWASGQVEEAATDHAYVVGEDGKEHLVPQK